MRLDWFMIQTPRMREYALAYNDFTMLDGTHDTNKYKLVMMKSHLEKLVHEFTDTH